LIRSDRFKLNLQAYEENLSIYCFIYVLSAVLNLGAESINPAKLFAIAIGQILYVSLTIKCQARMNANTDVYGNLIYFVLECDSEDATAEGKTKTLV
jgi:hypothetical protein